MKWLFASLAIVLLCACGAATTGVEQPTQTVFTAIPLATAEVPPRATAVIPTAEAPIPATMQPPAATTSAEATSPALPTPQPEATAQLPASTPTSETVLMLARAGGIAGVSELYAIRADGTLTKQIKDAEPRVIRSGVDSQVITALVQQIEETGIYDLAPGRYGQDLCCDRFRYTLTLYHSGKSYVYTVSEGNELPAPLEQTLNLVQRFAIEAN